MNMKSEIRFKFAKGLISLLFTKYPNVKMADWIKWFNVNDTSFSNWSSGKRGIPIDVVSKIFVFLIFPDELRIHLVELLRKEKDPRLMVEIIVISVICFRKLKSFDKKIFDYLINNSDKTFDYLVDNINNDVKSDVKSEVVKVGACMASSIPFWFISPMASIISFMVTTTVTTTVTAMALQEREKEKEITRNIILEVMSYIENRFDEIVYKSKS